MSFSRPLSAARPQRQRERDAVLRKTREVVRARSAGRCENPGHRAAGVDLAHAFGRGNIVGQPLCDHPTLCLWLCRNCHDGFDGRRSTGRPNEALEWEALRYRAVRRALDEFGETAPDEDDMFPVDAVRWLERRLRDTGRIHGREWAP